MAMLTIHGRARFEARPAPMVPHTGYLLEGVQLDSDDCAALAAVARLMEAEGCEGNVTYALRGCSK